MGSRRDQIKMTEAEVHAFLEEQRVVSIATIGSNGRPHLVPVWYVPDGTELRSWTYAKSQKAKNLERDPRATLQVETGVLYHELRGVMLECDVELLRDLDRTAAIGMDIFTRYNEESEPGSETRKIVGKQAPKRVGLVFRPTRIVSWDHRKLGGIY